MRNYAKRVGLNYYALDINAYKFEDLKKSGAYIWGHEVTTTLREGMSFPTHNSPTYVPYDAIATNFVYNLLPVTPRVSLPWVGQKQEPCPTSVCWVMLRV